MECTKGEWKILESNNKTLRIVGGYNLQVCEYIKVKDDAHLIAAAPDMYELLKEIRNADLEMSQAMEATIEIALAKAEGK